jgi:hypothetical protein
MDSLVCIIDKRNEIASHVDELVGPIKRISDQLLTLETIDIQSLELVRKYVEFILIAE